MDYEHHHHLPVLAVERVERIPSGTNFNPDLTATAWRQECTCKATRYVYQHSQTSAEEEAEAARRGFDYRPRRRINWGGWGYGTEASHWGEGPPDARGIPPVAKGWHSDCSPFGCAIAAEILGHPLPPEHFADDFHNYCPRSTCSVGRSEDDYREQADMDSFVDEMLEEA